ncbi:MAG: hypothetical protein ACREP2_09525 [Rhodanobacteraceae bacterium]
MLSAKSSSGMQFLEGTPFQAVLPARVTILQTIFLLLIRAEFARLMQGPF